MLAVLSILNFMVSLMITIVSANCEFETSCGDVFNFKRYFRMAEIYEYMDYLVNSYPEFVSSEIIGYSFEGREIKMLKISSGKSDANSIWLEGGIHAREWNAVTTVMYIVVYLIENRYRLETEILENDFYIVPIANPDGYEYTHTGERIWRKNRATIDGSECVGIDLNRNFPNHWAEEEGSQDPCSDIYAGPYAASEPEVLAIMNELQKRTYKGIINFHSFGQLVLFPTGYDNKHVSNYDELLRVGNLMAEAIVEVTGQTYTVGSVADIEYIAAGIEIDWARDIIGIEYCYLIELRDTGDHGHYLPSSEIIPSGVEGLAAFLTLVKQLYGN